MNDAVGASNATDQVELGSTGITVSRLILGCMCFGGIGSARATWGKFGLDDAAGFDLLDAAWGMGITTLDTASTYTGGQSERVIGKWVRERGHIDDAVVATKVGMFTDPGGRPDLSGPHIARVIVESLNRLGLSSIDFFLAHTPDESTPISETLEAFEAVRESGQVRAIGVCNVNVEQLEHALDEAERLGLRGFQWVQNGFNLFDRDDLDGVLRVCAERGLGYTPHTPLYGGVLAGNYIETEGADAPPGSRLHAKPNDYSDRLDPASRRAVLALAAEAALRGVSTAALAMAWILADQRVTAPIIGAVKPAHLADCRQALEIQLDPDERDQWTRIFAEA